MKGKDVIRFPLNEVEEVEMDESEMALFARNRLWESRVRSSKNGKGKEVVHFHPREIEEEDENVSDTKAEPREGEEEEDRI